MLSCSRARRGATRPSQAPAGARAAGVPEGRCDLPPGPLGQGALCPMLHRTRQRGVGEEGHQGRKALPPSRRASPIAADGSPTPTSKPPRDPCPFPKKPSLADAAGCRPGLHLVLPLPHRTLETYCPLFFPFPATWGDPLGLRVTAHTSLASHGSWMLDWSGACKGRFGGCFWGSTFFSGSFWNGLPPQPARGE